MELAGEGAVALIVGIGGQVKVRFEIGETEDGSNAIRLSREIEENRTEKKKWGDMIHSGRMGLGGTI